MLKMQERGKLNYYLMKEELMTELMKALQSTPNFSRLVPYSVNFLITTYLLCRLEGLKNPMTPQGSTNLFQDTRPEGQPAKNLNGSTIISTRP